MIRIHIFLILLLLPLTMRSQEDICIGKKHSLYSTVLQEERNYWVHLPDSYGRDTTQRDIHHGQRQASSPEYHRRRTERRPYTRPDTYRFGSRPGWKDRS